MSAFRIWLLKIVCRFQGHNCAYPDLPIGWSQQRCKTCGTDTYVFTRGGGR